MPVELTLTETETILESSSAPGPPGPPGVGVPTGGATGESLVKASNTDYDTEWSAIAGGASDAASVTFTPAGGIAATDVQAALEELDTEKTSATSFADHSARHEDGGADELNVTGLAGLLADPQTPTAHAHSGSDITSGTVVDARIDSAIARDSEVTAAVAAEAAARDAAIAAAIAIEDGAGLSDNGSGVLSVNVDGSTIEINADTLRVKASGITANEIAADAVGSSELADNAVDTNAIAAGAVTAAKVAADVATQAELDAVAAAAQPLDSDLTAFAALAIAADKLPYGTGSHTLGLADFTAAARALLDDADAATMRTTLGVIASLFQSGGAQAIKLDDLAAPDDNTDLDASTSVHGLLKKLPGGTTTFLRGDGSFATPAGSVADLLTLSRTSNTILAGTDKGKLLKASGSDWTQTLTAAATLGAGWFVYLQNDTSAGTFVLTVDPNGSETIDGLTTIKMYSGEIRLLVCDGTNFVSALLDGGYAKFTADGSFVLPAGATEVFVDVIGGGGGGGGQTNRAPSGWCGGSGGGGGARVQKHFAAATLGNPGDSIAVAVGAGGTGGTNATGAAGGATTFGSDKATAYGGGGGGGGAGSTIISGGGGGGVAVVGAQGAGAAVAGGMNPTTNAAGLGGAGGGSTNAGVTVAGKAAEWGGGGGGLADDTTHGGGAGGRSVHGGGGGGGAGGSDNTNGGAGGGVGYTSGGGGAGGTSSTDPGAGTDGDVGTGGGGGWGNTGSSTASRAHGGAGGIPGGGGGGSAVLGSNTPAGGNGGRGECRVRYS